MSTPNNQRFARAISQFDELNAQDPNIIKINGQEHPKELYNATCMTRWIDQLYPDANEIVQLAARCQHLCRWQKPRSTYPEGRTAYLKWRNDLKVFHAEKSAEVLKSLGYEEAVIEQVTTINLKKGLKSNSDVQAVEDALCMVFLETQFETYVNKWEDEKTIRILQKTWGKMSPIAQKAALELDFSDSAKSLMTQALEA